MPERTELQPKPELFATDTATNAWFAGVLEVGADAGITVSQTHDKYGHTYPKTLPYLEIHSTHPPMLERLHKVYGGMLQERLWRKSGREAAEIVAGTLPYSVCRQDHAATMVNWLNATDVEEQIEVARERENARGWQANNSISEEYSQLVGNAAFLAGVLDNRGYISMRIAKGNPLLHLSVISKNISLLQALSEKYGGNTRKYVQAGKEIKKDNVNFITKSDSFTWNISGESAINVINTGQPYMLTPPPPNYKYQRAAERKQEKNKESKELAERVSREVILEIALFEAGEIKKLSADYTLAGLYRVSSTTISTFLRSELGEELFQKRRELVKLFARRQIDAQIARQITEFITDEVTRFQTGELERVSYKTELAENFGVAKRGLTMFLRTLPADIKAKRLKILKSQVSRERNANYWGARKNNRS